MSDEKNVWKNCTPNQKLIFNKQFNLVFNDDATKDHILHGLTFNAFSLSITDEMHILFHIKGGFFSWAVVSMAINGAVKLDNDNVKFYVSYKEWVEKCVLKNHSDVDEHNSF